jgi:hypothetical protein
MTEPARTEPEILLADPEPFKLESGRLINLNPLKMRELLKLMRIITRGAAPMLGTLFQSHNLDNPDRFAEQLLALLIFAIPEAEDETIDFLRAMVKAPEPWLDPPHNKRPNPDYADFLIELNNPDPLDFITIFEEIITREKDDLASLGKRLTAVAKMMVKTGQMNEDGTPSKNSTVDLEATQPPMTSSAASTDGPTSTSAPDPSPESGKPVIRSVDDLT